uniref:Pecanex-like protein n=1 Tax=Taenia asiatica TaxID=60517 RepID=A0A0R3VYJ5_TAEAS
LVHTIFVLLLLEFRTKAPGARTIALFVGHRFGLVAHILTIIISLLTSLYTLTVNITSNMSSFYTILLCYNKSDHGIEDTLASTFDGASLSDGLVSLVHHAVRVLLDQALWKTAIMLPPNHGVLGLLLATIIAFCIPAALSVVCGLGFRALESAFGNAALPNATHRASGGSSVSLSSLTQQPKC